MNQNKESAEYWKKEAEHFEKKALERSQSNAWKAFQLACQELESMQEEMVLEFGDTPISAYEFQQNILKEVLQT